MDELIAFLRAALDEDERVALASDPGPWEVGPTFGAQDSRVYVREAGYPGIDTVGTCVIAGQVANKTRFRENAVHIARWDPARVLAEVEAKRRILAMYDDYHAERRHLAPVIWEIAQPYAGRDGWREEWAAS